MLMQNEYRITSISIFVRLGLNIKKKEEKNKTKNFE